MDAYVLQIVFSNSHGRRSRFEKISRVLTKKKKTVVREVERVKDYFISPVRYIRVNEHTLSSLKSIRNEIESS